MAKTTTNEFLGTGRRKTAIARVRLAPGSGKITVNGRTFENYFALETLRELMSPAADQTARPAPYGTASPVR
jgi:small subunit ribosomal protein S9